MAAAQESSSPVNYPLLDPSIPIEEEKVPGYKASYFYPVRIGEVFQDRYQVVGKLGHGISSTVWLCRDLKSGGYVTVKVRTCESEEPHEIKVYRHINQLKSEHVGRNFVRRLLDSFELVGPEGRHTCLVHEPLSHSVWDLQAKFPNQMMTPELVKPMLRQLLVALDYLHKDAKIVHTDIQPANLLIMVDDKSIFTKFEEYEAQKPAPRKEVDGRTIYKSRMMDLGSSLPKISDFGEARWGTEENRGIVMPSYFRAPEVILGMKWSYEIDVWATALMTWRLLDIYFLFSGADENQNYSTTKHLAEMVSFLGPPPKDFLQRSEKCLEYWDEEGNWRNIIPLPKKGIDEIEADMGKEESDDFFDFMRFVLRWKPEDRPTAEEALFHPWLMKGFIDVK